MARPKKAAPVAPKAVVETPAVKSTEPLVTSLSIVRSGGYWAVATIVTQGLTVVSREVTEPNLRAIALADFKVKAANLFMGDNV